MLSSAGIVAFNVWSTAWMTTQLRAIIVGTPQLDDHPDDQIDKSALVFLGY